MTRPVPADRDALVEWARNVIAQGSQSFATASHLYPRLTRERTWLLYSWCRTADDITDGQELGHGASAVHDAARVQAELEAKTAAALDGGETKSPAFAALRQVVGETGMPHYLVRDHIAGFALDARDWRPANTDDLLKYCYHVAGTVGCMMAVVMGVDPDDEDTLDRACDLGLAFQLANIARDIVPDAKAGRCYLPGDWLREHQITEAGIFADHNRLILAKMARRLVDMAANYRASARIGAARLSPRSRLAVLGADAIYGAIGEEVVNRGPDAWSKRVRIGKAKKLRLLMLAAIRCFWFTNGEETRTGLWTRPRHSSESAGSRN